MSQMPNRNHTGKEGFVWAHSFRGLQAITSGKPGKNGLVCGDRSMCQEAAKREQLE